MWWSAWQINRERAKRVSLHVVVEHIDCAVLLWDIVQPRHAHPRLGSRHHTLIHVRMADRQHPATCGRQDPCQGL